MSESNTTPAAESTLRQDILALLRYWLRGRRGLIVLAAVMLGAGAYFNWSWFMAAGIAPILLALAPCAAMCAMGHCMKRGEGDSCSSGKNGAGKPLDGAVRSSQVNDTLQR